MGTAQKNSSNIETGKNANTQVKSTNASLSRVSGRPWKAQKKPTNRTMMAKPLKKSWDKRMKERRDRESIKLAEKELKDEKQAEKELLRQKIVERRKRREEKERQEKFEAEMSARKRMRLKRKELKARAHAKH